MCVVIFLKPTVLFFEDPSGVWMGPPDKREPKLSDNRFERSSLTLNDNERFQKETEKVKVSSTAENLKMTTSAMQKAHVK